MFDNLNSHDGREKPGRGETRKELERLSDREVPIGGARTSAMVHAWLDGDASEASLRQSGGDNARHIEFWSRVATEASVRRQVTTPAYLPKQIMAALPQAAPHAGTGWWQRPLELSPAVALVLGTALLTLGVLLGAGLR